MLNVHLRITDAGTGRPTPARLRITGPDGAVYFPFGSHHEFPLGRNEDVGGQVRAGADVWCYVDGGCEIRLPAGVPLRVRVLKGPEYLPHDQPVTLGPGQMAMRFSLTRWTDRRAEGWFSGDVRSHFLPPHAALLEAGAEDVAIAHLLACETMVPGQDGHLYPSVPHLSAFSGQRPALQTDSTLVAVNTLNIHPVLGKVGLLHSHRVVFPITFGGGEYPDDWSVCDWCDQCHRKNGLTVWADPFDGSAGTPGGEALVALVLGKIDAFEYDGRPRKHPVLPGYYLLLNAGFLVPLVGGSGKDSNRLVLGSPRTYARLPDGEPLTTAGWADAVRAGRCFASNGPLLRFTVDGRGPGEAVEVSDPGAAVRVTAVAESVSAFDRLEVVADGLVIRSVPAALDEGRWSATLNFDHTPGRSGWLAARAVGETPALLNPDQSAFAHTAPVAVRVAGAEPVSREPYFRPLRRAVEQTRDWVELHGIFADEKWKRHLLGLCDAAVARLAPPA